MIYESQKEIAVTLQVQKHGVDIFADVECTAIVDHGTDCGEIDWKVVGFDFQNYEKGGKGGKRTLITEINDPFLFGLLKSAIDDDAIMANLSQEYKFSQDSESGYFHSAVLAS